MTDSNLDNKVSEEAKKYNYFQIILSKDRTRYEINSVLETLFARAYKEELHTSKEFYTPQEWILIEDEDRKTRARLGAKKFKRKVLGFSGTIVIKNLEDLAKDLFEVGAVESLEEGKVLVPYLDGAEVEYSTFIMSKRMKFNKVTNQQGEEKYKVETTIHCDSKK